MIAFCMIDLTALRSVLAPIPFAGAAEYAFVELVEGDQVVTLTPSPELDRPALYARWTSSLRGGLHDVEPRMTFEPLASNIERRGLLEVRARVQKGSGASGQTALAKFGDLLIEWLWAASLASGGKLVFRIDLIAAKPGSDAETDNWGMDFYLPFTSYKS